MEMTYSKSEFKQVHEKRKNGTWWSPGSIELMQRWAISRSEFNGHSDLEVIVDNKFERAIYCPNCNRWGSMSSMEEDFGIFGSAIFKKCDRGTNEAG